MVLSWYAETVELVSRDPDVRMAKRPSQQDAVDTERTTLRFVSWNVLADSLLRGNSDLYTRCNPACLPERREYGWPTMAPP